MARVARAADAYGVYHISQSGSEAKQLFKDDVDRMKFLEILNETKQKFGFKLFAYCLQNPNAYHIVLRANGNDLSKIMKSINIAYALHVKYTGRLFKDRYKSIKIDHQTEFDRIKSEINCNRNNENCFTSDSVYCDHCDPFEDICEDCIRSTEEAYIKLESIAKEEKVGIQDLLADKGKRNALIVEFRRGSLLSLKDIGLLFGGLSESTVSKILKSGL